MSTETPVAPSSFVPYIPDSAPFTPAQRAWLNGFFAGIFSQAPGTIAAQPAAAPSVPVSILFATQSGTAEGLSKKVAKELKAKGHDVKALSLDSYSATALAEEKVALVIASTYGDGDPPDNVKAFYDRISDPAFPPLDHLNFAVLALGDSHYEHFCKFGRDLEERFLALGAKPMLDRVDCDVDLDEPFAQWKSLVAERLATVSLNGNGKSNGLANGNGAHAAAKAIEAPAKDTGPTRDHPFLAPLIDKRDLTHDVSSKQTVHLAFSLTGSGIEYEAGDALGVIAANDPCLVDDILAHGKWSGEETVTLDKGRTLPMREALLRHLGITQLSRKLVQAYATTGQCAVLLGLLPVEQQTHLDTYMYGRGVVDLLSEFPGVFTSAADFVSILPKLPPRLYSISSSPRAHAGEVHTTVAVVRYRSWDRQRGGVCSTMFADRMAVCDTAPVYIQVNKKFRLPADSAAPVIMIGPGTGIAPFRAFLHDRQATGATGKNWLFFGERSAATDFLYREELEQMVVDQHLTRLDLAFSRDQQEKIYVQDRMLEQGAMFWAWLQDGASLYVCGDASRMAKDVDKTLHKIVTRHGGLNEEAAAEFVSDLKDHHRYHRDVY